MPCPDAAFAGLAAVIVVNESCMNVPIDSACAGTFIGLLKSASSLTTLATVLLMLWQLRVATRLATTKASAAQQPCATPPPPPPPK